MIGIYLRVSTDKQETQSQRFEIIKWCRLQGYPNESILEYSDDGVSGTSKNRPELNRLISDVQAGKLSKVITFESSRLSRDFMQFLNIMAIFSEAGVTIEVPNKGPLTFGTSTEKQLTALYRVNFSRTTPAV